MGIDIIPLAYYISSDENFAEDMSSWFSGSTTVFVNICVMRFLKLKMAISKSTFQ